MKASIIKATKKSIIEQADGVKSLLTVGSDSKTVKGQKKGYMTGIVYMMPTDDLCPMSKAAGCRVGCLVSAGRAAYLESIGIARRRRTELFQNNKDVFVTLLFKEIDAMLKKAAKQGMTPAIRLNGTSDINWGKMVIDGKTIFQHYPTVQFYDYTKSPSIVREAATVKNWHVTASYSGASDKYAAIIRQAAEKYGANLAVVFPKKKAPAEYLGREVINGDDTDLRFLDDSGKVVALSAKGQAKKDDSGFVIRLEDI